MVRKPVVFCLFALLLVLVLPSLAKAENPASPKPAGKLSAPACGDSGAAAASTAPDFLFDQAPELAELPGNVEDPMPAACYPIIYKCVKCTISTVKICEYWSCSGTLKGCYPCSNHC